MRTPPQRPGRMPIQALNRLSPVNLRKNGVGRVASLSRTGRGGPSSPKRVVVLLAPSPGAGGGKRGGTAVGSGSSSSQHLTDDDTTWSHLMAYPLHRPDDTAGVAASPSFPAMERDVLAYWAQDGTFQASIDQRPAGDHGSNEFVFYDGPPFANGLPHYGHLLTGYVKDVVPRYQTMRGKRVERRFGWDTHGLPAELEAMRQLGIKTKIEIDQLGVAAFNEACRESVLRYTKAWRDYVTRQARWVDFERDYKTLDLTYMESVMWAFKQLFDKGLVYECLLYTSPSPR